ncbi:uracil-DNA glycosylase [Tardisphaera miroshnichenkoae]
MSCRLCPRLVAYREEVAKTKKREFASWTYWGKPLPGFGDRSARLMIVGLAPAAHGGNRTGRMFTGDSSGAWLMRALYKAGLANKPTSERADDGLELRGVYVTAVVRCAPPANKPTPQEIANCRPYLVEEIRLVNPRAFLALGSIALNGLTDALGMKRQKFAHGKIIEAPQGKIVCSYHPSRQNTNTGRLTEDMLDAAVRTAKELAGLDAQGT